MIKKKFFLIIIFPGLFLLTIPVYATMPVIDYAAIAKLYQQYRQLQTQYQLLVRTYENAEHQLSQFKQMVRDSEGHYGFGKLKNNRTDLKLRQWSPDNWEKALKGLSGGNPARYEQLVDLYRQNHPILSSEEYRGGAGEERVHNYEQQIAVNRAAVVQASYAFDDINSHFQQIHDLSVKIEEAPNTKAAIDLNSRLLTELAYISIQTLKMEILVNQQLAQRSANEIAAETREAQFNRLPEE